MTQTTPRHDPLNHAPDRSETALLLIDVINPIDFDGSENLLRHALPMARAIATLKRCAKAAGVPAIYVNDNFGRWRSDFPKLVESCLQPDVPGRPVVEQLVPEADDYFVLKPKHSAFFQSNLEILLNYLGVNTLILTGLAGDICVLFSANDAYMRDYHLVVPADCVASNTPEDNAYALLQIERVLKGDTTPSTGLDLEALTAVAAEG